MSTKIISMTSHINPQMLFFSSKFSELMTTPSRGVILLINGKPSLVNDNDKLELVDGKLVFAK